MELECIPTKPILENTEGQLKNTYLIKYSCGMPIVCLKSDK